MFRCISSMNCHNILEYMVASSLCSAAAASSLCISSWMYSWLAEAFAQPAAAFAQRAAAFAQKHQ
jgi:hypothetical protein